MMNKLRLFLLIFCGLLVAVSGFSQAIPKFKGFVNDFAGLLNNAEVTALEHQLQEYSDSSSLEIAVCIEKELSGESLEDRSISIARSWKIGRKEFNSGVLIYVALKEKKVRIETGYGTEGFLTDGLSKRLVDNVIKPNFKAGNYYKGLSETSEAIKQLANGEFPKSARPRKKIPVWLIVFGILGLFTLLVYIQYKFPKTFSGSYGSRGPIRPGGGWYGGGGFGGGFGGGSSGGGFGGFGGGGFGGGGASGGW